MDTIIKSSTLEWIKYSNYEYKLNENGETYICPTAESQTGIINPAQIQSDLVLDSLNIGRFVAEKNADMVKVKSMILNFCRKYGLLGFMVSFPLSEEFLEKKHVLLGENPLTEKEIMLTKAYIKLFTPFRSDIVDAQELPLAEFLDRPPVYGIVFAKDYAEKPEWVIKYFQELYLHFEACFYFDKTNNPTLQALYSSRINSFKLYNLGFKMKVAEKPMLVWDFVSLKVLIDTVYAFMVSDSSAPIRICKHCGVVFTAKHIKTKFCSPQCRNQYNVYKSRGKQPLI